MADIRITPASSVMSFTSSLNYIEKITQDASGSLNLYGSGSTGRTEILSVDGNNGRLFTVSDDLSDSLFSVNTIAGLPVIEAFADNSVNIGQYSAPPIKVIGANAIITGSLFGTASRATVATSANQATYADVAGKTVQEPTGGTGNFYIIMTPTAVGGDGRSYNTSNLGLPLYFDASSQYLYGKVFVGDLSGNADTATSANTATNVTVTANNSTNETTYLTFVDGATGTQGIETDTALSYNPSTNVLTVGTVSGALSGTATNASNITITNDTTTNATYYPVFVSATSGNTAARVDSSTLTYNPSTNTLTTTTLAASTLNVSSISLASLHSIYNYSSTLVITANAGTTISLGGGPGGIQNNVNVANGTLAVNQTSPQGRLHVYQSTNLGGTTGNNLILQTLQNTGGSGGNNVYIKDYALRDATGTSWTTWRHHNSIDIDGSHNTPGTNTKAFYERDPLSGLHEFGQEATYAVTIDGANSRLGVATRTPIRDLQVGNFTGNREICIGTSTTGFGSITFGDGASGNDPWRGYLSYNHSGDYMVIGTTNGERVRVTAAGAMGLGVTPTDTSGRFEASNDIVAYSSSDKRWKTNIKNIDSPLEKISQINGVEFDWIEDEPVHGNKGHDIGVIAQEIEQILPDAVQTRESGMKAVKYEKVIPLLIEAIKDQQKQIDELKQIINGFTR